MTRLDKVEVYSSFAYAVEPRAFYAHGLRHEVRRVIRMWKTPGRIHFRIVDQEAREFELIFDEANEHWSFRPPGETSPVLPPPPER